MNAFGRFSCLLALLLVTHPARADGNAFRLTYAAPAGCPPPDAIVRAIQTDSPKAHPAAANEPAVAVDVMIGAEAGGYVGIVRIRRDGAETTRAVPAVSCDETLSALALIAAIAVDPEAVLGASATPGAGEPAVATFPVPAAPPPPPEPPPEPAPPPPAPVIVPPARPETTSKSEWHLSVAASVGATSEVAPTAAPDFGVGLVLHRETPRAFGVAPWLKLSAQLSESLTDSTSAGQSQFERLGGRVTGCPVAGRLAMLDLRPCLFFEAGRLRSQGSATPNAKTVNTAWLALAPTVRGELELPADLALDVEIGPLFPLVRDSFYFQPGEQSVHSVGPVGLVGSVELLLRFL